MDHNAFAMIYEFNLLIYVVFDHYACNTQEGLKTAMICLRWNIKYPTKYLIHQLNCNRMT